VKVAHRVCKGISGGPKVRWYSTLNKSSGWSQSYLSWTSQNKVLTATIREWRLNKIPRQNHRIQVFWKNLVYNMGILFSRSFLILPSYPADYLRLELPFSVIVRDWEWRGFTCFWENRGYFSIPLDFQYLPLLGLSWVARVSIAALSRWEKFLVMFFALSFLWLNNSPLTVLITS